MEGNQPPTGGNKNEQWIDLLGDNSLCLLAKFNDKHQSPISDFSFYNISTPRANVIVSILLLILGQQLQQDNDLRPVPIRKFSEAKASVKKTVSLSLTFCR